MQKLDVGFHAPSAQLFSLLATQHNGCSSVGYLAVIPAGHKFQVTASPACCGSKVFRELCVCRTDFHRRRSFG
jgi:hypothetical protein